MAANTEGIQYQIQSSPYFRRMMRISERNGELQRLREEYERMRQATSRSIEKRLDDMREQLATRQRGGCATPNVHNRQRQRLAQLQAELAAAEQERLEQAQRARELGQLYSRRNACLAQGQNAQTEQRNNYKLPNQGKINAEQFARRQQQQRLAHSYGNDISRINRQRIEQRRSSGRRMAPLRQEDEQELRLKLDMERWQSRLHYGNTCSGINMALAVLQRKQQRLREGNIQGGLAQAAAVMDDRAIVEYFENNSYRPVEHNEQEQLAVANEERCEVTSQEEVVNDRLSNSRSQAAVVNEKLNDSGNQLAVDSEKLSASRSQLAKQNWLQLKDKLMSSIKVAKSLNVAKDAAPALAYEPATIMIQPADMQMQMQSAREVVSDFNEQLSNRNVQGSNVMVQQLVQIFQPIVLETAKSETHHVEESEVEKVEDGGAAE